MKSIFLLIALFALACSSEFEDNYGCELKGKDQCCWINYHSCCEPPTGKRTCANKITLCCKKWVYSIAKGSYEYEYTSHEAK